jgi:hypothetical protein
VHDEKAAPICGQVYDIMVDLNGAETHSAVTSDALIVIAGNEDDPRSLAGLAKKLLQHVIMRLQPQGIPPDAPKIDDVTDEIDRVSIVVAEKIKKSFGLACPRAEMEI